MTTNSNKEAAMNAPTVNTDQPIPRHRVLAKVTGKTAARYDEVLTPDALLFLAVPGRSARPPGRNYGSR